MSMRTRLPWPAAASTTRRAWPSASCGSISAPSADSLIETLASRPSRAIASSSSTYSSAVAWHCATSWTNSPSTSTVAAAPIAFSAETVDMASASVSPAM